MQNIYNISPEELVLLFVGRLGKEKNVAFLIRAFQQVSLTVPKVRLVLVGKGPQESQLHDLCKQLNIEQKVTFTGALPRSQVVHCYAGAHLFVFPSVTDTQGLVIGEAKSTGLPVVAIRAFGPAEMVKHGEDGYLTEPNQAAFANAILELLNNPVLYRRMRENALKNARLLTSSYCAERMLESYERLIGSRS